MTAKSKLLPLLAANWLLAGTCAFADSAPTMGWSSWNTYHVDISDSLIMSQADAMALIGLKDLGYKYINIDDGFFGGRDSATGHLLVHPTRFPNGLKPVADHIHALGLKAGIYSDAGRNTCGNYFDKDTIAVGVGLYGHDLQDARFFFNECGFDFIKIDFCGGVATHNTEKLALDEKERYSAIRAAIDSTGRKDVRINVCRWDYPGTWVEDVADSWRISHDIRPRWSSVKDIIRQNLYLSAYASPGHYNDMDMLEVGRGMSADEDLTHFSLWCIMSSPLLIGCDLTTIKPEALKLISNPELIALNQDELGLQAYVAKNDNGVYLLTKDLKKKYGNTRAAAIYNSTDSARTFTLDFRDADLGGTVEVRDIARQADMGAFTSPVNLALPPHSTITLRLTAEKRLPRIIYEAETAYLSEYQELHNSEARHTATYKANELCNGAMAVYGLGMRPTNDLQWRNVYAPKSGKYVCTIATPDISFTTPFIVNVNGRDVAEIKDSASLSVKIRLEKGENTIRLYTKEAATMPAIDYMTITQ